MKLKHIMLDLETFDNGSNSLVCALGAVRFDPRTGELGETFYRVPLDMRNQQTKYGRTVNVDTVLFWMEQEKAARDAILRPGSEAHVPTLQMLSEFQEFVGVGGTYVWGNGTSFDNTILRNLYEGAGLIAPWRYENDMCYHTVKTLAMSRSPTWLVRGTVKHNALEDAIFQANQLAEFYKCVSL